VLDDRGRDHGDLPAPAPGDPPTLETAKTLFGNLFFNPERYDLSAVGRLKLNYKFYRDLPGGSAPPLEQGTLTTEDILNTIEHLIDLKNGRARWTTSITSATAACARWVS
jgi:hypothetical protein